MPLFAGDKLGAYEILAPIGAGGMGEVYRARDTKLAREVAIKVLPHHLAQDPERLARFEREAKVLASLNHPNIAQIYGIEERALVMELVPGETLKGPLPLETALSYARQIADALEAAHEKGITHRDLKPANIMITPAGVVKVLDFGLAAVAPASAGESDPADSPTLTMHATKAGMIMGTAGYMSPEQASGKPVDRRADIWSFGVVLWEMLTGHPLFTGETISHTLADVLKGEIDFKKLPPETPVAVRHLLQRCLDRDVKNRLQWIGEARIALEKPVGQAASQAAGLSPAAHGPVPQRWPWAVAGALAIVAAIALWAPWRNTRPTDRPLVRLDVDLGPDVSSSSRQGTDVIISPDGTRLVYVSQNRLFTRRLDQPKAAELAGTDGAFAPFFSPDGQWVAFFVQGKLKKISVEGGAAIALYDSVGTRGGSWGEDGNIIAGVASASGGLSRIPSAGGALTPVTELAQAEVTHRWPQVLPGGKAVLFTAHNAFASGFDGANIEVMSLADHRRKTLVRGGTFGRYSPSGHLLYINKGTLFAVPFDLDTLAVRGTPSPVLQDIAYNPASGAAQFDLSRTGTLVYQSGGVAGGGEVFTVQWLDGAGKTEPLLAKADRYLYPRLSPDGTRLAVVAAATSGSTNGSGTP